MRISRVSLTSRCLSIRLHFLAASLGLALVAAPGGASAQTPAGRSCHSMTAAAGLGVVVFGGSRFCGKDIIADTTFWRWDGSAWSALPGSFPDRREDALLVFDSRRKVLVLYGGRAGSRVFSDTWEWNGTYWARKSDSGSASPGPLEHSAAAFDSARGRVVVFGGGSRDGKLYDATWEWDGARWERRPSAGPAARVAHAMAGGNTEVFLYGGFSQTGSFTDLWRWDGMKWERLHAAGPTHTEGPALVSTGTELMVVGAGTGEAPPGTPLRVWAYRGGSWTPLPGSGPPLKVAQGMAYDPARRTLVLFGGAVPDGPASNELWEFDGSGWRRP